MKTLILILFTLTLFITFIALKSNDGDKTSNGQNALTLDAKKLDANTISTWFRNNGSFNRDAVTGNAGFEWPKASNKFARYAAGLWIGAVVNYDTLITVCEYDYEYLPGYTDIYGQPEGRDEPLYRIYRLTYGVNDLDRQQWPNALLGNSDQGAPVYFDNQTSTWKPLDFGTQTMFYSYTDSYPESHGTQGGSTSPLHIDVKQLNFSLDTASIFSQVAFSQFKVINRGVQTWNNTFMTIWSDDDLGQSTDDKIGCDTNLALSYTYNANNNDPQYGSAPPAVGFLLLRGGLTYTGNYLDTVYTCENKTKTAKLGYKDLGMKVFNWYANGQDPHNHWESYRCISGYHPRPGVGGDTGLFIINPITNQPTHIYYPGDPVTGNGWVQGGIGDDQRFMISTGPLNINPGDTQVIVTAQIIAKGTSNLNSITLLRQYSNAVREYYNSCYNELPPIGIKPISGIVKDYKLEQNYPNPFNPVTRIKFDLPKSTYTGLIIYDVIGREVAVLLNEHLKPGSYEYEWNASSYPSGVYFYKLVTDAFSETKKMVLIK
jgi:hypothetical protein